MAINQIIFACWLIIFTFSLYAIGRIIYQLRSIPADYLIDEKVNWNAKLNPYKVKIYFFFIFIFLFPLYLYKISVTPAINKVGEHQLLTTINEQVYFLLIATIIISLSYWLLEFKIKSETKSYIHSPKKETQFAKVLYELKPSLLNDDEIKKQFDYALKQNYFDCELLQFENLLKLNEPIEKIIWKPITHVKYKDRQLLLSFLHNLFQKQLNKKDRKGICEFINKYFELNEIGHNKQENPFTTNNIEKWINNPKGVSKA